MIKNLNEIYPSIRSSSFNSRYFKHADLENAINSIASSSLIKIESIGSSYEGRNIYLFEIGRGRTNLLFWSQMHGNEPTGTLALFDLINFLNSDLLHDFTENILNKFKIFIIPMLNPDGAEYFQRENSLGIDINRDALQLTSPEALILSKVIEQVKPEVSFNLHDQDRRWIAGKKHPAVISLLAPPIDELDSDNRQRIFSKKIIIDIYNALVKFYPDAISRYNSDFEIRSFGDFTMRKGYSTILIESGRYFNDYRKEIARKLNFLAFTSAFLSLMNGSYKQNKLVDYSKIPLNRFNYFDLILRNVTINKNGAVAKTDVALNIYEISKNNFDFFPSANLEFVGDLKEKWGLDEIDCDGYSLEPLDFCIDFIELPENSNLKNSLFQEMLIETNIKSNSVKELKDWFSQKRFLKVNQKANFMVRNGKVVFLLFLNGKLFTR